MDYLFFDIECANCDDGKGKICSFGYVLTDEEFNIIKEDDIVINPCAPFHLTGRRDKRDIILSYLAAEFANAPPFPFFAEEIFALLTLENTLVCGYAIINDINFLLSEGERYSLKVPDFAYCDIQLLYSDYMSVRDVVSLERAGGVFGTSVSEVHNSREDARDTLTVAKGICNELGLTFADVRSLAYRADGKLVGGEKSVIKGMPKRKNYLRFKESLCVKGVEFGEKSEEYVRKVRIEHFNIFGAEKRIYHNYDSGTPASSTIGELLKDISFKTE